MDPTTRDDFSIAIICALPREAGAVQAVFDRRFDVEGTEQTFGKHPSDINSYTLGRIASHNVVLVHMGGMGKVEAAAAAALVPVSFPNIRLALVVGICGATPYDQDGEEIILGDVIISNNVIQYDFGKQYPDGFIKTTDSKDTLGRSAREIRGLISKLEISENREILERKVWQKLQEHKEQNKEQYSVSAYPGKSLDRLFSSLYVHKHRSRASQGNSCICFDSSDDTEIVCLDAKAEGCEIAGCSDTLIDRPRLSTDQLVPKPTIHIGRIISSDTVMKSAKHRDYITNHEGSIAFEMESSGAWGCFPCVLVIKSVSDYADSHKNKAFQNYAAVTAACCTAALLEILEPRYSSKPQILLEPSVSPVVHTYVPFPRNKNFVGRQQYFHDLEASLFGQPGEFSKASVSGLGGMGKSALAIEMAYRIREKHPNRSIFWVVSVNFESLKQSYLRIAQFCHIEGVGDADKDPCLLVKSYLSQDQAGEWLLIFDNADDPNAWYNQPGSGEMRLADYVPASRKGSAILTTRNRGVARKFSRSVFNLDEMDSTTSLDLLYSLLDAPRSHEDNACQLLEELEHLPLAIVQAAAYINEHCTTIEDYLPLLRGTPQDLIEVLTEDFEDDYRDRRFQKNPIASTWLVSFEYIQRNIPLAARYLSIAACIDPKVHSMRFLPFD